MHPLFAAFREEVWLLVLTLMLLKMLSKSVQLEHGALLGKFLTAR